MGFLVTMCAFRFHERLDDCGGHDLGYSHDIEMYLYPLGPADELPTTPFRIRVHVARGYVGAGVLLGTQHQLRWRMETSYQSGMKTIGGFDGVDSSTPQRLSATTCRN